MLRFILASEFKEAERGRSQSIWAEAICQYEQNFSVSLAVSTRSHAFAVSKTWDILDKRRCLGVFQQQEVGQGMAANKPGPVSVAELGSWPLSVLKNLLCAGDGNDGERLSRLRAILRDGMCVYSDYSGLAGEYEIWTQMREALAVCFRTCSG